MNADVVVIHSGIDRDIAGRIAIAIKERGIDVWIDPKALIEGHMPADTVRKVASGSRVIVYVLSKATSWNPWILDEHVVLRPYFRERGPRIVPVKVEECVGHADMEHLRTIDLSDNFNNGMIQLEETLRDTLSKRKVFVCYSSKDKDRVSQIVSALAKHGHIELWYDENSLSPGDILRRSIEIGIASADYLLAILTHNAIDSIDGWIGFELDQAYELERERNKYGHYFAVPVVLEEDLEPPGWLATKVRINLAKSFEAGIQRIIKAVSKAPLRR